MERKHAMARRARPEFRRPHSLGPFLVGFFCASARLVVEPDRRSRHGRQAEDSKRQSNREEHGPSVIRFTNDRVLADLDAVVEAIRVRYTLTLPSP